jgi:TP901 family phage tail tape measure protein
MSNTATLKVGIDVTEDGTAALAATSAAIDNTGQAAQRASEQVASYGASQASAGAAVAAAAEDMSAAAEALGDTAEAMAEAAEAAGEMSEEVEASAGAWEAHAEAAEETGGVLDDVTGKLGATAAAIISVQTALKAIGIFAGFSDEMQAVAALTQASALEMELLKEAAFSLSGAAGGPTALAKGFGDLAAAGASVQQIIGAGGVVRDMSNATRGTLDFAAAGSVLTDILNGYKIPIEDARGATDIMAKAWLSASQDAAMLTGAVNKLSGLYFELYGHLGDTAAITKASSAISILADVGIKGAEGATLLRNAFTTLLNPTGQAAKVMEKYADVIKAYAEDGSVRDLPDILDDINKAQLSTAESFALWGADMPAMQALLGAGGDKLREFEARLKSADGTIAATSDIMQGGLGGSFRAAGAEVEKAAILLVDPFVPALQSVLSLTQLLSPSVQFLIGSFETLAGWTTQLAGYILKLVQASAWLSDQLGLTAGQYEYWQGVTDDLIGAGEELASKGVDNITKAGGAFIDFVVGTEAAVEGVAEVTRELEVLEEAATQAAEAVEQRVLASQSLFQSSADAARAAGADAVTLFSAWDAGAKEFYEKFQKINGVWVQLPDAAAVAAEGTIIALSDLIDAGGVMEAEITGNFHQVIYATDQFAEATAKMADDVEESYLDVVNIIKEYIPAFQAASGGADAFAESLDNIVNKKIELDQLKQYIKELGDELKETGSIEIAREIQLAEMAAAELSGEIRDLEKAMQGAGREGEKAGKKIQEELKSTERNAKDATDRIHDTAAAARAASDEVRNLAAANQELAEAVDAVGQAVEYGVSRPGGVSISTTPTFWHMTDEQVAAAIAAEEQKVRALENLARREARQDRTTYGMDVTRDHDAQRRLEAAQRQYLDKLLEEQREREKERFLESAGSRFKARFEGGESTSNPQDDSFQRHTEELDKLAAAIERLVVSQAPQPSQTVNITVQDARSGRELIDQVEEEIMRRGRLRV